MRSVPPPPRVPAPPDGEAVGERVPATMRWASLAFVVLVASLSIEWISLGPLLGGNLKGFHVVAIGFAILFLAVPGAPTAVVFVARRKSALWAGMGVYLTAVGVAVVVHVDSYFQPAELPRQVFYAAMGAVVAGFAYLVVARHPRLVQWCAPITVATVVVALSLAVARRGGNPLSIVARAVSSADPSVINTMFRAAFRAQGFDDANVNLRHKVFAAVLIAMWVTVAALGRRARRSSAWPLRLSVPVAAVLVVLSLSRSLALALLIAVVVSALRPVISGRADARSLLLLGGLVVVVIVVVLTPAGELLRARFLDDTSSYEGRTDAASSGFLAEFGGAAIIGTTASSVERSPHNFVLDAWLSGGVVAWVGAMGVLVAYVRILGREVTRHITGGPWSLPVEHLAVVGLGALPLVRMFTAGAGLHLTDWVAIGLVLGLSEANLVRSLAGEAAALTTRPAIRGAGAQRGVRSGRGTARGGGRPPTGRSAAGVRAPR